VGRFRTFVCFLLFSFSSFFSFYWDEGRGFRVEGGWWVDGTNMRGRDGECALEVRLRSDATRSHVPLASAERFKSCCISRPHRMIL
jgi:hypothetical protein